MPRELRIDNVGFNVDHWAKKTEKQFVDDCLQTEAHPLHMNEQEKTDWLKEAHKQIKASAAEKPKEVEKAKEAPAKESPAVSTTGKETATS